MNVEQLTFKEWNVKVRKRCTNPDYWQHAGDWFFPSAANNSTHHRGTFYHMCEQNWKIDMRTDHEDKDKEGVIKGGTECCMTCGLEVPDGIKMIASLLSW
jgi:hypothetical protein